MTSTPESDVRAALDLAAQAPRLTLDTTGVLQRGRRTLRRRRLVGTALGVAGAVVVVAALQATGSLRAAPTAPAATGASGPVTPSQPARPSTSSSSATTAPRPDAAGTRGPAPTSMDESGVIERLGGQLDGQVRLRVRSTSADSVEETWTFVTSEGPRTVKRTGKALAEGEFSLLMPSESGIPETVLGYVNTSAGGQVGGAKTFFSGLTLVTDAGSREQKGGSAPMFDTKERPTPRQVFFHRESGLEPARVIGVAWWDTAASSQALLLPRASLWNERTSTVAATRVADGAGNSWIAWADATRFGVDPFQELVTASGPLRLMPRANVRNSVTEALPDAVFGWVAGADPVTVTSSRPGETFDVSYSEPVNGQRAFVATASALQVHGTVTVSGAGRAVPLGSFDELRTADGPG